MWTEEHLFCNLHVNFRGGCCGAVNLRDSRLRKILITLRMTFTDVKAVLRS